MNVSIKSAVKVCHDCFGEAGVSEDSISVIMDTMLYADRRGLSSHGLGRLPLYIKKIASGHLNPAEEIETVMDDGAVLILDANNGFGQVAADRAVRDGITRAKRYGISAVGVRNSNNFGTAGYFGRMAAEQNMAAMVYANAAPAIAPVGGNKALLGTNPICYAFPGGKDGIPIVFDMATSVVARGKIRLAAKNGEKIPMDWAVDRNGKPTDDPEAALDGALQPMGGGEKGMACRCL